ncbi:MAG: TIGR03086 family metal-binding protein [Actinomycetota bacterium]|nr:TIGR03086 family metal-binding protein [Actinomycetota bacterium]
MDELVEHHRLACDGFSRVAHALPPETWSAPTPCTEWTARDVVEHVIGFHEFLLLRPLGARAHRPRDDPAARWDATSVALFTALAADGVLDRSTELPGGGESTPRAMIGALTTDVLVHTWDLARAARVPAALDEDLCARGYTAVRAAEFPRDSAMFDPEVAIGEHATVTDKLVAFYGRDPAWEP